MSEAHFGIVADHSGIEAVHLERGADRSGREEDHSGIAAVHYGRTGALVEIEEVRFDTEVGHLGTGQQAVGNAEVVQILDWLGIAVVQGD